MTKAQFYCSDCNEQRDIYFEPGNSPETPKCEKCGKIMKRKFNNVGKGSIVPDDIMYASRMMSYQSSKK